MNKVDKILALSSLSFTIATGIAVSSQTFPNPMQTTAYAKAKVATLGSGTYKVGRDIQPGRYVITATNGSGNLSDDNDMNIILGTDEDDDLGQITSYTTYLPKGDKVKVDGIESVSFAPVAKRKKLTTLSAGQWVVGKDIKPGRYTIKASKGSGNLTDDQDDINEIIGTSSDDDQVTHTTQDLTRGAVLKTDAQEIILVKK